MIPNTRRYKWTF